MNQSVLIGTAQPVQSPEVSDTPESQGMPGADSSHEIVDVVNAVDVSSITVDGVKYDFTSLSVIHGTIQVGYTVRLTFGSSNSMLIVDEVKITTNMKGSSASQNKSDSQGNSQGSSRVHVFGTPPPGGDAVGGGFVVSGGRSNFGGSSGSGGR